MTKEWKNPQLSVIRNDELKETIVASACSSNSICVINVVCANKASKSDLSQF